ncbi:helix-turn-helix domain-containing protein [Collinsella intestinalis]|uniref:XRE family transcriptional regulator n=1 Tax=Collinsella intestinalis TaxID=147207 RepID=A0A414NF01_9ACTN|nr:helix-turn-helix transcriptional regulator [Collinsella intestinalis]RHF38373.1 XRE family transcriptional regulator [Collinsella intestinalis]
MNATARQRLGENLIAIRKTSGLTKVDFALQLGISRVLLDLIESGNSNLKLSTLEQIAERLGVQPWELIR